jgi:N utilization substance protein A
MPAIQRSEFALALNQVATERGVDPEVVLDTVKNAILAAYRKDHPDADMVTDEEGYTAELNPNTGEAKILHEGKDITPPGFGRIAAQTAKQVILQKIREKEKEAIITDYKVKIGTVVSGVILRFAGPNVIVDIGKTEAVMPPQEQIPTERYHQNLRLSFYLVEIREGLRGEEVIVSRASTGLIEGLFRREVPEVASGSVEIRQIVREAGTRTKMAVFSDQSGIDPVGSCVGQKGVRVQAVLQEVNGEKIDIIQWTDDIKSYITQALAPAKDVTVHLDEEAKIAKVNVPEDQLSLAIGKDGQNVRLASKLTGYRIEIEGAGTSAEKAKEAVEPVAEEQKAVEEEKPTDVSEDGEKTPEEVAAKGPMEAAQDKKNDEDVSTEETEESKENTSGDSLEDTTSSVEEITEQPESSVAPTEESETPQE